jgi:LPS-assembly lipoprotein
MSLSDRRLFLFSLVALGACGFTPVYGPGGTAEGLRGTVFVVEPDDREGYELVKRLEERLGRSTATARYRLGYEIETRKEALGVTTAQISTRVQILGTVRFSVIDTLSDELVETGEVTSFTSYSDESPTTTVSATAAERDALRRLMVALADMITTRLIATAPGWPA